MPGNSVRDIIVIGGSAGAIEGSISIVRQLPPALPAAIGIVVHHNERTPSVFGPILDRLGTLPVVTVSGEAPLSMGTVYVPESDRHLIVESSRLRTVRSARENRARPAVDPLFRSAAKAFGPRVLGVVLSGNLDDGAAGLLAIRRAGGATAVQDPEDAMFPGMPLNALQTLDVDHRVPLADIPALLVRAVEGKLPANGKAPGPPTVEEEVPGSSGLGAAPQPPRRRDEPAAVTCPTCHGALSERIDGHSVSYLCHTGHTFGLESLLAGQDEDVELALWSAIRALQERIFLLGKLISRADDHRSTVMSERHSAERTRLEHHVSVLRRMLEAG
jgi:two-component system chemotaxis response regulator CheB